jgi:uridine kinase
LTATPYLVGLAGGSGSGKTALARELTAQLPPGESVTLELDSYYLDRSGFAPADLNFDEPAAFDHQLLFKDVKALARGEAINKPVYNFANHSRLARTMSIAPQRWVLIEGLFALYWPEVRDLLDLKVFIDSDHQTCLERRLARDVRERGRTRASIEKQYWESVRPMFESHLLTTRDFADLIIDGQENLQKMAAQVLSRFIPSPRF